MKKVLFLSLIFYFQSIFSQVSMSGNKLEKDGQLYAMSEYRKVFKNVDAINYFSKSRTNATAASVVGFTGGLAVGGGLANILFSPKMETFGSHGSTYEVRTDHSVAWLVTGIGAGLIVVGIPFALAAKKNTKKAIKLENGESTVFQPYFRLETAGNGLALSYNF